MRAPVIGANVGGIKYSVKNGETGYLIPPKDPEALAKQIDHLLADKTLLKKMQVNCLQRVHKYFTWKKVAESVASVYEEVFITKRKEMSAPVYLLPQQKTNLKKIQ